MTSRNSIDEKLLVELYSRILLEFSASATKKMVIHFKRSAPNESDDNIEGYINRFERIKSKLEKRDPFQYKTFAEFENTVDANDRQASVNVQKDVPKEHLIVFENSNVIVYKARNAKDCITLGDNAYYSFCISRPHGGNLYASYRLRAASTFYFVRFKDKSAEKVNGEFKDPSHYIVIDAESSGKFTWTWADNGTQGHYTKPVTQDVMIKTFPDLVDAIKYIKNDPITAQEQTKIDKFRKIDLLSKLPHEKESAVKQLNTLTYQEKMEYVQSGYFIPTISILDSNQKNEYLNAGGRITLEDYDTLTPSEAARWLKLRVTIAEQNGYAAAYLFFLLTAKGQVVPPTVTKSIMRSRVLGNILAFHEKKGEVFPEVFYIEAFSSRKAYRAYIKSMGAILSPRLRKYLERPDVTADHVTDILLAFLQFFGAEGLKTIPDHLIKKGLTVEKSEDYYTLLYYLSTFDFTRVPQYLLSIYNLESLVAWCEDVRLTVPQAVLDTLARARSRYITSKKRVNLT